MAKKQTRKPTQPKTARKSSAAAGQPPPLNAKQLAFVEHYLACWNGAQAARLAGYATASARQQASDLLTKPNILEIIQERLTELHMGADEVLARLAEHARVSVEDFLDDEDEISLKAARERGRLHLAKRLTVTRHLSKNGDVSVSKTVEPHDAQAALGLLGKHHKLFTEKVEHSGGVRGGLPLLETANLTDEELDVLEKILSKANGTPNPAKPTRAR